MQPTHSRLLISPDNSGSRHKQEISCRVWLCMACDIPKAAKFAVFNPNGAGHEPYADEPSLLHASAETHIVNKTGIKLTTLGIMPLKMLSK